MYNRHLETFIQAADSGSFLKASERLYVSANAVTKQINLLESHLELKLFHRSTQGLELTPSGKLIYSEAKKMIRHSHSVLQKAHELEQHQKEVIRIGVSLMNPASVLLDQWSHTAKHHPEFHLEIIPFEDTVPAFLDVLDTLGEKIDLLSCPYQSARWESHYNSFHLKDLPMCIACAKSHPLAEKSRLKIEDLYGMTLILAQRGHTGYIDPIWDDLEQNHPLIHLKGADYLDINFFNQLTSSDELLLSAECWNGVHPLIATIPVDWDYTLPYGLIYPKEPARKIMQFLLAIGQVPPNHT